MSRRPVLRSAAAVAAAVASAAVLAATPAVAAGALPPDNRGTDTAVDAQTEHMPYGVGAGRKIG